MRWGKGKGEKYLEEGITSTAIRNGRLLFRDVN